MMNDLHINLKKVESVRNDVEYWLYVIRAIYLICPKGYIELQALCSELYGDKAGKYLSRLQLVGVKVKEPVLMKWPLAFVAGCYEKLIAADYEKAYALFLVSQSCHEL